MLLDLSELAFCSNEGVSAYFGGYHPLIAYPRRLKASWSLCCFSGQIVATRGENGLERIDASNAGSTSFTDLYTAEEVEGDLLDKQRPSRK